MKLTRFALLTIFFALSTTYILAVDFPSPIKGDLKSVIQFALGIIRPLIILIFLGLGFQGGYMWMTAGDNESQYKDARKILTAAVLGFMIIALSAPITSMVCTVMNVKSCTEFIEYVYGS